eukprot:1990562-Rhodomonas_salina.4
MMRDAQAVLRLSLTEACKGADVAEWCFIAGRRGAWRAEGHTMRGTLTSDSSALTCKQLTPHVKPTLSHSIRTASCPPSPGAATSPAVGLSFGSSFQHRSMTWRSMSVLGCESCGWVGKGADTWAMGALGSAARRATHAPRQHPRELEEARGREEGACLLGGSLEGGRAGAHVPEHQTHRVDVPRMAAHPRPRPHLPLPIPPIPRHDPAGHASLGRNTLGQDRG